MNIIKEKDIFYIGEKENPDAYVSFVIEDNVLNLEHTVVNKKLEGQGIASLLVKEIIQYCEDNHYKIYPLCSFAQVYLKKHPEHQDLAVNPNVF